MKENDFEDWIKEQHQMYDKEVVLTGHQGDYSYALQGRGKSSAMVLWSVLEPHLLF
jgi:hypothetical protein